MQSFETGGDSAGPSSLTVSDRRRAAHRDLVKRGASEPEHSRTGRRKRARREHSRARQDGEAAGSSVLQPEGDEHEINSDTNNDFDGLEHYDSEPDQPVQDLSGRSQPDTGPADDEHAHSQEDRRSISPLRSPPPPDPDRNEDAAQPPQRNLDQRARIDVDVDALEHVAVLPKQKDAIMFIRALQRASLDDPCAKLNDAALQRLRHPLQEPLHIEEPAIRHGIISYFALEHSANEAYERIRNSAARNFEGAAEIPSHARIERLIAEYTGIESIEHDMCPDTCVAFTGPFAELVNCPICGTERYDPIKLCASGGRTCVARQKFITIPLGTQLQALWRDPEHAQKMSYLPEKTERLMHELRINGGVFNEIDDFVMGTDYVHAVLRGDITKDDVILMISMDGAQLYESKQSDCWIYIWVVMNHAPGDRYKKKYVLPGGFIPGPNKPKNVDSFLFPGMSSLPDLPLPPAPNPSPPRHGAYLPAVPFTSNTNKENVPVVLKNPLANIFGGPSGIPKLIPPPALPPSTAVNEGSHIKSGLTTGGADVKKGSKMRPGATKNGRNLCALRWLKKINKNGTTDEFKLYFNGLSPAQQKQYQTEADNLISAGSWNKASDSAIVDGALH